jgi:hypothetical protein
VVALVVEEVVVEEVVVEEVVVEKVVPPLSLVFFVVLPALERRSAPRKGDDSAATPKLSL